MGRPIPLIAAVNETKVTLGIMPGAGGKQNLPRAVGERRAKELTNRRVPTENLREGALAFNERRKPNIRGV
jgi:enoyl-CoA hydratase/carnithine racemase